MPVILNCINLLGDSLYLLNPVEQYIEENPGEVVGIVAHGGLAFELFQRTFSPLLVSQSLSELEAQFPEAIVLKLEAGPAAQISFKALEATGKQPHISEAYAALLGMKYNKPIKPTTKWASIPDFERYPPLILLSAFSRSCTFHDPNIRVRNKTIDDWKWEHIIRYLRKFELPIKVLASDLDILKCSVPLNDYVNIESLLHAEKLFKSCKLFVTVDNGLGHLGSCFDTPTISLWPVVSSMNFIAPVFNKRIMFLKMQPDKLSPVGMMVGFRKFAQLLIEEKYLDGKVLP